MYWQRFWRRTWSHSKNLIYAILASFGGLLFGYNASILGLVVTTAEQEWNLSLASEYVLSGVFFLGAIIGAIFIGKFTDLVGRRDIIMTSAACYAFSSFACAVSTMFEELLIARLFLGCIVGVTSLVIPLYLAEIANAKSRGAMVSYNQVGITTGIVLAFVLESTGWDLGHGMYNLYTVGGVLAILVSIGAIILPESPAWLIKQGDDAAALRVLRRLGREDATQEVEEIKEELAEKDRHVSVTLLQPSNRKILGIGIGLFVVQQLSGINFVLLTLASPATDTPKMHYLFDHVPGLNFLILVGLVNLLSTLLFVALVDRVGRRPLLLVGLFGMAGSFALLIEHATGSPFLPQLVEHQPLLLLAYIFFFAISLGPIPWLFVAEMHPLGIRGISMSVSITANWVLNAMMALMSITMVSADDNLIIYVSSLFVLLVAIPCFYFFFPESKRLNFTEISAKFHRTISGEQKQEIMASLVTTVVTIGGILFGYNLTVIAGVLLMLQDTWSLTAMESGVVVSSVMAGAMLGSFISGNLASAFGRRYVLMMTTVVFIVGSAVSGLATEVPMLVVGRFVNGVAMGVTVSIVPLYIAEISPPSIRGRLNSILHLSIVIGSLVAYLANTMFMSQEEGWRQMLYIGAAPALVMGFGLLFLPESPRWLISQKQVSTAKLMLQKLLVVNPDEEIATIQGHASHAESSGQSQSLLSKSVRPALLIGLFLMFLQECTGINTLSYYGPIIFQAGGIENEMLASLMTAVGVGGVKVVATLFSFKLVDQVGRRPLFLVGILGIIFSSLGFGVVFALLATGWAILKYLILLFCVIFIGAFSLSLASVCGIVISELYPQSVRAKAIGMVTAFNLICAMIVSLTLLPLVELIGFSWSFFLNAGLAALGIPFWYYFMPETKGKTLEEIERHWLDGKHPAELR